MTTPTAGIATATSAVAQASTLTLGANMSAGFIQNPLTAADQGIAVAEVLYVDPVAPRVATGGTLFGNNTTIALQPGASFSVKDSVSPVYTASNTASHKFVAIQWA